ncbi:MAG: hypothetical protein IJL09_11790 [Lachnospiraceae bacterium]|nr:hypothetical protein [Lachnospiraceae bacterium]
MQGLRKRLLGEMEHMKRLERLMKECPKDYPDGKLRIFASGGRTQYYQYIPGETGVHGRYISKKEEQLVKLLAQKDYDGRVEKLLEKRIRQLGQILKDYQDDELEQLYFHMGKERQALIAPVENTFEQLLETWKQEAYEGKAFRETDLLLYSEKGERVRSKSEKILADYFFRNGIPYKYEKPLLLKGYGTVYPDFTLFSPKLRKEIYWEHEGRMDDPVYARSAVKKIYGYEQNRIFEGERLILTYETEDTVMNTRDIERKLAQYY